METETPEQQALQAATNELFGLGYQYAAGFTDRIDAVQLNRVRELAGARLSHCVVTICTPNPQRVHIKQGEQSFDNFPPVDLTPRGVQHDVGAK